ncbi:Nucleotide-binding universal stress protein, UspA family [Haladaptatus litoreus]|uniref:Nucleotide-binding universal stress protein, UspA family n=1 Tax=Haladaptatus litoreus TaxID=553468 RepID=A0A1N6Y887_9EURY|nr:universal stress protein [Haladaptatus litoreus]SIR10736.1 Nucleotide-binding universal stress protein, UspA family [Haladaptatus litoreus]
MYDRILVPTDGSAETKQVVAHAAKLAEAHGAELHAIYVVNSATFASLPMETSWEGVTDMLQDEGESALEDVQKVASRYDVSLTTHLVEGAPNKEIVRYAEQEGFDLIVMGTHGRGGIDRLLLGSVAERVVRASTVPVLTVRVEKDEVTPKAEATEKAKGSS